MGVNSTDSLDCCRTKTLPWIQNSGAEMWSINELKPKKVFEGKIIGIDAVPNFDIDGDGKLNPKEKAAMEAYFEKIAEQKVKNQFDFDGDGKLNEKEQAAYDAYTKGKKTKQDKQIKPEIKLPAETKTGEIKPNIPAKTAVGKFKPSDVVFDENWYKQAAEGTRSLDKSAYIISVKNDIESTKKKLAEASAKRAELQAELNNTSKWKVIKCHSLQNQIDKLTKDIAVYENHLAALERDLKKVEQEK